jgi:hypothetical protein
MTTDIITFAGNGGCQQVLEKCMNNHISWLMLLLVSYMELRTSLEVVQLALGGSGPIHKLGNINNGMSL